MTCKQKKETGADLPEKLNRSELENRAKFDFLLRQKKTSKQLALREKKLGNKKRHITKFAAA